MTSTTSGSPSVAVSNPPTFSYAQAAKGRGISTAASAMQSSQGTSGVSTPAKEATSSTNTPSASVNGAGGSDGGDRSVNGSNEAISRTDAPAASLESTSKSTTLVDGNSSPSSPSFGTASTSTLPKDDDLSLTAAPTATSVWDRVDRDRRTQAASGSDRPSEAQEGRKGKGRKGNKRERAEAAEREKAEAAEKEKEAAKEDVPLVAAPLPAVNIWQQRMATQPPKAKPSPLVTHAAQESIGDSSSPAKPVDSKRRGKTSGADAGDKSLGATQNGVGKDLSATNKGVKKGSEGKEDVSNKRVGARGNRINDNEKLSKLPPPVEDAVSWPTPETALEEEKRKAKVHVQEKSEKEEKDETASNKPRPKEKWVPVPYTPSVTFNTPIPQRGGRGRGGGRGGREAGSRGSHVSNGSIGGGDKSLASVASTNPSAEARERGRDGLPGGRAASLPPNSSMKRPSSDGPQGAGDQRKASIVPTGEKSKAGLANSSAKGELGFVADPRTSNGTQAETTQENPRLAKNDNSKSFKPDQAQGAFGDSQFNASRADRRSEPNIRGPDQVKDNSTFSRDGQQARDRADGRAERGRGGFRGRGGYNNVPNAQQHPQHAFTNGHGPAQANGYPVRQNGPYSPPLPQPPFSNQYVQTPGGRGRGGSRSQSIPNNAMYGGRYPNGNASMAPLQTSVPPMYDYQSMQPMSAIPYHASYMDQYAMLEMVKTQLEYYFSINNLCKDVFLRKHMDSQGFVFLSFIAGFKRITALTQDFDLLRFACQEVESIDIIKGEDGIDRLRRKDGWEQWVLPMGDRDESTRIEGPAVHYRGVPQRGQPMGQVIPGSHTMSPQPFSPNGTESAFQSFPGASATSSINGNGYSFQGEKLSAAVPDFAPGLPLNGFNAVTGLNGTPDPLEAETTFTDEEVHNLTLVFTPKNSDDSKPKPFHSASSRTFSNGSIDGKTIDEINDEFRQGRGLPNGSHATEM